MIWLITNWLIFETVPDTNTKELENSKETLKFSLATLVVTFPPLGELGSSSTGNDVLSTKRSDRTSVAHSLVPQILGPHARRHLPMGTSEAPITTSPIPQSLPELRERISQGVANVDESQLRLILEELEYRIVTNGSHIERLYINFTNFHAVFKLFHVCICNRFEYTLISYHQNHF
jgi:hypothetical protein